jgi:Domain of unknown function (DUF4399)
MNLRGFWSSVPIVLGIFFGVFAANPGNGADQPPSFVDLKDGATVTSPIVVNVSAASQMSGGAMGAHTHLIIDSPLPAAGEMILMDTKHVHLMHGETQTILQLPPGDHTLQLVVGGADHKITTPVLASEKITIHIIPKPPASN